MSIQFTQKRTLPLLLIYNTTGRTEETRQRREIKTEQFTNDTGAYVIRYKNYQIPGFKEKSGILKIGCTIDGFKNRFENYNHQSDMTVNGTDLFLHLKKRSQKTNVRLMYFLAHTKHPDKIFVDFYNASSDESPAQLEYQLLKQYFSEHNELPTLNFDMK